MPRSEFPHLGGVVSLAEQGDFFIFKTQRRKDAKTQSEQQGLQERLADEFFLGPCVVLRSLARPCIGWQSPCGTHSSQESTEVIGEEREYWVADPWGVESF